MKTWTVDEMVATGACYSRERIVVLWAWREALSPRDILTLDIPAQDRLWVCWRQEAFTPAQHAAILDRIVRRAVKAFALPDPSTAAWARRWLDGDKGARTSAEAAEAARAAGAAWAATAARTAEAARAAWAVEAAWAAEDATAVRAAGAAWAAWAAEAAGATRAAGAAAAARAAAAAGAARAARAARAAEADRQITDVLAVLDEEGTPS
jgi:hypothetical protein